MLIRAPVEAIFITNGCFEKVSVACYILGEDIDCLPQTASGYQARASCFMEIHVARMPLDFVRVVSVCMLLHGDTH